MTFLDPFAYIFIFQKDIELQVTTTKSEKEEAKEHLQLYH